MIGTRGNMPYETWMGLRNEMKPRIVTERSISLGTMK